MADLDREEDLLLEMLQPAEELRAVIPGMRNTPEDGEEQVLIGVTDRRVVLVGRRQRSDTSPVRVMDLTHCVASAPRGQLVVPHIDGHLTFDIGDDAMSRLWTHIDEVDQTEPPGD